MVVGLIIAAVFGVVLYGVLALAGLLRERAFASLIMAGYAMRLLIHAVVRDVQLFSHAAGGDSLFYEALAKAIAVVWSRYGIHFVSSAEIEELGPTSLPPNLFAVVTYFGGPEATRFGCAGLIGLAAGITIVNVYLLCLEFGAEKKSAFTLSVLLYFAPSFLFYTSDMYKDGLVLVFTTGALGSALRLARRFAVKHLIVGLVCVAALWYVRFYLIFVTVAPLLVGAVGLTKRGIARSLVVAVALVVGVLVLFAFTDILQFASNRATETLDRGTSTAVLESNQTGGSGVVFDDGGSPYGALPAKLAYTLLSPFPWARGSLGFQLGKVDVLLWYFILYRAVRAVRKVDARVLIMFATFVVPCALGYAMSMSNVGLIVRQRLVIVVVVTVIAALYTPQRAVAPRAAPRDARLVQALARRRREGSGPYAPSSKSP